MRVEVAGIRSMKSADVAMLRPLARKFYNRDARSVAKDLLGKVLVRREQGTVLAGRIVEDEAYLGENDPAAHSAAGRTARNSVLFGPPGHAYVYFIYGAHFCLNVSCLPEGNAGCVLIRALEPLTGIEQMARLRKMNFQQMPTRAAELRLLTSGPGRLCQALAITRARDNAKDLTTTGDLWISDDGFRPDKLAVTPRIGITRAAGDPLRYLIAGNLFVSGKRV